MLNVETKKVTNQWYYLGTDESFLENMSDMMTLEDLHNDSRLIIISDFMVLTDEQHINEVKHNYEIEDVKTINEWAAEDPFDYFYNCVDGEITHSDIADQDDINKLFGEALNNLNKEDLIHFNWDELYIKCAKKAIINNLRKEANRLEKEWSE